MNQNTNILIADDDSDITASCLKLLMRDIKNARVSYADTPEECRKRVLSEKFDIIFLDIHFAGYAETGLDLLPELKGIQPDATIFMLSSADDAKTVIKCMNLGAADFISKKDKKELNIVERIKSFQASVEERLKDTEAGKRIACELKLSFASKAMIEVLRQAAFARRSEKIPVLITGETGVGKDVIARVIGHKNKPTEMVTVDCGAIPSELAESEFFGHIKGSFTGAVSNKEGKFQLADGGDLFLDEIGNLKPTIQEKLLRATQSKEITPIGGTKSQKVDVRLIFATNENLDEMVEEGRFRQDFLERIRGIWIRIPSLRERTEDIPVIINSMIAKSENPAIQIAPACMSILCGYNWPGNVRELENVLTQMIMQASNGIITPRNLPASFLEKLGREEQETNEDLIAADHIPGVYRLPLVGSFKEAQAKFIKLYILDRFESLGQSVSKRKLARELGMSRSTLERYESELQLELPNRGGEE